MNESLRYFMTQMTQQEFSKLREGHEIKPYKFNTINRTNMQEENKYILLTAESIKNIQKLFEDPDELRTFCIDLHHFINETMFITGAAASNETTDENILKAGLKIIFVFGILCRKNMDLIRDIVKHIDYKIVSEKEKEAMIKNGDKVE